jgi:hypothetical protein
MKEDEKKFKEFSRMCPWRNALNKQCTVSRRSPSNEICSVVTCGIWYAVKWIDGGTSDGEGGQS